MPRTVYGHPDFQGVWATGFLTRLERPPGAEGLITERFTRVSDTELFYRYTVEDAELYTQPWSGERSMTRHDGPIYEYGCHEGNYSMENILLGGQAEMAARAETGTAPD